MMDGHKELHRFGNISVGIFDRLNFYVGAVEVVQKGKTEGREYMPDIAYYTDLGDALLGAAGLVARRDGSSLQGYISAYRGAVDDMRAAVEVA